MTDRLRASAGGRFHVLGSPRVVVLGEVLVHGEDASRPLGASGDAPPSDAVLVLDVYRRVGPLVFRAPRARGVRLVAVDAEWSAGAGPEVRGRAVDLLLLLANTRAVLPSLTGPGVTFLA